MMSAYPHDQYYFDHDGYLATRATLHNLCAERYDMIQNKICDVVQNKMPVCTDTDELTLKHSDILVVTWNVNEHALTAHDVEQFFASKLQGIQPKIFVMALQEVDTPGFNFLSDSVQDGLLFSKNIVRTIAAAGRSGAPPRLAKNKDIDIDVLTTFFMHHGYTVPKMGTVSDNNQLLFVVYKEDAVKDIHIRSTVLTSNYIKTKGALAVSCKFNITEDDNVKQICFVSAHLSAHSDVDQNKHPADKKYFMRRVDEMYDLLHKCDTWHKKIHSQTDKCFLPFNVILEGDLNFRMIKNSQNLEYDEGRIVLDNFDFHEMNKEFRQTYRVNKASIEELAQCELDHAHERKYAQLGTKRFSAWTDRISFHNPLNSATYISQETYGILDQHEGPSDHLPVFSTFDMHDEHVHLDTSSL